MSTAHAPIRDGDITISVGRGSRVTFKEGPAATAVIGVADHSPPASPAPEQAVAERKYGREDGTAAGDDGEFFFSTRLGDVTDA